jgi:hypothetical protein
LRTSARPRDPSNDFKPLVVGNAPARSATRTARSARTTAAPAHARHVLGKPTPDWQGTFGFTLGFLGNFELTSLFEYKMGDFVVHDLSGEFRRTHAGIGRNTPNCARLEAIMRNPASTAEQRLDAALEWAHECEGLAPLDGLNSHQDGDFDALARADSLTYRVPTASWIARPGQRARSASARATWLCGSTTRSRAWIRKPTLGRCNGGWTATSWIRRKAGASRFPRRFTFSTRVSF